MEEQQHTSNEVIAYRLSVLEHTVAEVDTKLDGFMSVYPSRELLDLKFQPLVEALSKMTERLDYQDQQKAKDQAQRNRERFQLRLVLLAAFLGPIASFILAMVVSTK